MVLKNVSLVIVNGRSREKKRGLILRFLYFGNSIRIDLCIILVYRFDVSRMSFCIGIVYYRFCEGSILFSSIRIRSVRIV